MKNFKYIITILLITTSTLFCSCSRDYNEIESRAFILGVGMDYNMVSKQFIVSAETVEGREGSVAAGAGSKVITGRGKSVFDAVSGYNLWKKVILVSCQNSNNKRQPC